MSGGGGGTQSTTEVQQIPKFEQEESLSNQQLANSLASQAYPTYQGALQAGFTPQQQQSFGAVQNAAGAAQPYIGAATATDLNAMSLNPANSQALSAYMSPYVNQALQPQIQDLNTELGQQQNQIGAQATEANAFGDARQGVESGLANYYGDQSLNNITATGYNTAFTNALSSLNQEQQNQFTAGSDLANLGSTLQSTGLTGANALYDAGATQQNQTQQALNLAYQQYQNQVQWPYQMLDVRESALSNSPYDIANQTTLPGANSTATALGSFASLAGGLGALTGGSTGNTAPFGSPSNPG